MHPLFHLIATRPQLLAEHAQAYAELASAEVADVSVAWKRAAVLNVVALFFLVVAALLTGVAVLLWAVTPTAQIQAPWALFAVPLVPVALALGCLLAQRTSVKGSAFEQLRRQMKADMALLREAETP